MMRARRASGGFTLLEMIVVLAVLALVLVVVLDRGPAHSTRLDLDGAARIVATALRAGRAEAIARGRPVRVTLDVTAHDVQVGAAQPHTLPPGLALTITPVFGGDQAKKITSIAFLPDGSSSGGRIEVADLQQRVLIGVDWLTGRVTMAEAQTDDADDAQQ